jgi:hypothetical protein
MPPADNARRAFGMVDRTKKGVARLIGRPAATEIEDRSGGKTALLRRQP